MASPEQPRRLPPAPSQVIDRDATLTFTFDGREITAYAGDTIASALAAAGVDTVSRSFKYHRPRGLLCVSGDCPNCLVNVEGTPNVRACRTPVEPGMAVHLQNAWPSLSFDAMSAVQLVGRFLPAGFYYKAFMRPKALWPAYERVLRNAAGLGTVDAEAEPGRFDKRYRHADVAVVGAGPAGLHAAIAAAGQGARVALLDENPSPGGHLRYHRRDVADQPAASKPAYTYGAELAARAVALENIDLLPDTLAFGAYDHGWLGAVSGNRLIKLRAGALIVATGAYEQPLVFPNNDLPGVMLGGGVLRLLHLWGVVPGKRAVIVSANPRGLHTALDLLAAGVTVAAVAELRADPEPDLVATLREAGVDVLPGTAVIKASGRRRVDGVTLALPDGTQRLIACDLLVIAAGSSPAVDLAAQSGGKFAWDAATNQFGPVSLPDRVFVAGEAAGTHELADGEREGQLAGLQAAAAAGFGSPALQAQIVKLASVVDAARAARAPWSPAAVSAPEGHKDFVCLCEDVTRADVRASIEEGYDSIELLKRFSTVSMGPCQGKMCSASAARLCAQHTGMTVTETGTTTSRPPVRPLELGALGGRLLEPVRVTPLHEWHLAHGAHMMNAGVWKRPEHYGDPLAEVQAVRQRVGVIDISTLGKLHLHGPGIAALLERLYTNRWQKLGVGRVRYGVMVNEEGIVFDDGVTARLADDFAYMTTTSSGASRVYEWIEWWLQSAWRDLQDVHVLNATDLRAAINLAGPHARDVLARLAEGVDLSNEAFPYMHARQATVVGVPALLMRVGFTGELSYEIHVPSGYALRVWEALLDAGAEFGITPFGVEAQRVLRLEKGHIIVGQDTDALTNPFEAGLGWAVKLEKPDFLGRPPLMLAGERGAAKRLVGFEVPSGKLPQEADQIVRPGDGPLGLEIIGRITSVRRSPTLNKVIGLAWLPTEMAAPGTAFTARVRGELVPGQVVDLPFYDPAGERLRR